MYIFSKPITAGLAPNLEDDDVRKALNILSRPNAWMEGQYCKLVEQWFKTTYNTPYVASFNSGRSALYALLKVFGIGKGDEVIVQAFTCVVVPNTIIWCGAKPVYSDIDETLNIDPVDLRRKITSKTKAVIIQHTFGVPAVIDKILGIATEHKLLVIEDCAHVMGSVGSAIPLGSYGDAAMFSFGRDKALSSVFGGVAIIQKKHKSAGVNLLTYQKSLSLPPGTWVFQQLMHVISFPLILYLYNLIVGKLLLYLMQKVHLLSLPVTSDELQGAKPSVYPSRFPNGLAVLAQHQLGKLNKFNVKRIQAGKIYKSALAKLKLIHTIDTHGAPVYLRFPLITDKVLLLTKLMKKRNIIVGNWYRSVIDPPQVDLSRFGYIRGTCPNAEKLTGKVINLPTNLSEKEVRYVISSLQDSLTQIHEV